MGESYGKVLQLLIPEQKIVLCCHFTFGTEIVDGKVQNKLYLPILTLGTTLKIFVANSIFIEYVSCNCYCLVIFPVLAPCMK